jgi:hypothetical protein
LLRHIKQIERASISLRIKTVLGLIEIV